MRTFPRELDPIGSGDALAAVYLHGMLRDQPIADRVELAAMTYCIKRTLVGDHVPISPEDLHTWIASDARFVR